MFRYAPIAAFATVLFAFLLPFGTMGCDEEQVRVTGIELATFRVPGAARAGSGEPNLAQEVESGGGFFALVALVSAAAGLALAAAGMGWWGVLSGVGLAAMLVLPYRAVAELADVWVHEGFALAVGAFCVAGGIRVLERAQRRRAARRRGWPYAFAAAPLVLVSALSAVAWLAPEAPPAATEGHGPTQRAKPVQNPRPAQHPGTKPVQNLFPSWSPDGRKIAFVRMRGQPLDIARAELWVMLADGRNKRRLATGRPGPDDAPIWSPDGRRIAFEGPSRIYVIGADGRNLRQLTRVSASTPRWSPDGRRIAYEKAGDIYVMNADGTNKRRLTRSPHDDSDPAWSPDGRRITFTRERPDERPFSCSLYIDEIHVIEYDGSNERAVRHRPCGADHSAVWSPDGRKIAFTGCFRRGASGCEIYTMNTNGTDEERVTPPFFSHDPCIDNFSPAWSPDGRKLAFVSDRMCYDEIYVIRPDGSGERRLTGPPVALGEAATYGVHPAWSPDGQQIAFEGCGNMRTCPKPVLQIIVMNADGSHQRRLT